jgi:hypothetical protein
MIMDSLWRYLFQSTHDHGKGLRHPPGRQESVAHRSGKRTPYGAATPWEPVFHDRGQFWANRPRLFLAMIMEEGFWAGKRVLATLPMGLM